MAVAATMVLGLGVPAAGGHRRAAGEHRTVAFGAVGTPIAASRHAHRHPR
ncbi:hypothetical protein [Micrococcus yunnanensis]